MNECFNKYSLANAKDITDYKTSFFLKKRCMYNERLFLARVSLPLTLIYYYIELLLLSFNLLVVNVLIGDGQTKRNTIYNIPH